MLYLCCIFAPGKEFFKDNLEFYSSRARWIEANNGVNAIRDYKRYNRSKIHSSELKYTKVLYKGETPIHTNARVKALEVMTNYFNEEFDNDDNPVLDRVAFDML